jgi:hypothetical protein
VSASREAALRAALAAGLCGLVFYALLFPVTDTDLWWHLAAGRKLLEEGRFLRQDLFAADVLGRPWINLHWLFQLAVLGAYRLAGLTGVVVGKAALGAAGAYLLLRAGETATGERTLVARALGVTLVALPIFASRFLLLERPVVVTLVLLAAYLLVLELAIGGRPRLLWALLPLQVVWVNAQGGLALLGPAIVGAALVAEGAAALRKRPRPALGPLLLCLAGVALACLINPYGPRGLGLPALLLARLEAVGSDVFALNVSENIPPFLLERTQAGLVWHFKWVAAAAFASFLATRPSAGALRRLLVLGGFFGLALAAGRNVLLFEWVAGFVATANLVPAVLRWRPRVVRPLSLSFALLALVGPGALRVHARAHEGPIAEPAPFRVPAGAVERLRGLSLPGRVFNSVRYGGYLAWQLYPRYRPGIDGRLVLRTAGEFATHLDLLDHPERFEAFRREHDIRIALLPSAYPDRYLPLLRQLARDPRWRILFTDGTETLLALDESRPAVDLASPRTVEELRTGLTSRFAGVPHARDLALTHLGRLLAELGELERAAEVLVTIPAPAARGLLARVHYLAGRREQARALARALLAEHPGEVNSLNLLALIALDEGQHQQALDLLRRALESDPFDVAARRSLLRLRAEAAAK